MRYPVRGGTNSSGMCGRENTVRKKTIVFLMPEFPLPHPLLPPLPASYKQSLCLPRIKFKEIECVVAIVIVLVDRIGRNGADSTRPKKHACSAHAWEQSRHKSVISLLFTVTHYRYSLPLLVKVTLILESTRNDVVSTFTFKETFYNPAESVS
jgi:hypothetical protein